MAPARRSTRIRRRGIQNRFLKYRYRKDYSHERDHEKHRKIRGADPQKGQVVSKTLAQNAALSVTLFSFDKGEEISAHSSSGDAFVTCLDGIGQVVIDGKPYELHEGESIVMPAGHPHSVHGKEQFKMLLVVVK